MWFSHHLQHNPELGGYVLGQHHKCGKPNCHCRLGGHHRHVAYYHYFKVPIVQTDGTVRFKRKKKYVEPSEVGELQQRINEAKSMVLTPHVSMSFLRGWQKSFRDVPESEQWKYMYSHWRALREKKKLFGWRYDHKEKYQLQQQYEQRFQNL